MDDFDGGATDDEDPTEDDTIEDDTPEYENDSFEDDDEALEPSIDLHGSFENQLTAIWPRLYNGKERVYVYDYVRLRVDLDADLPGGLELKSDLIGKLYVGDKSFHVANLIPRQTIDNLLEEDPRFASMIDQEYKLENDLYIDNVYLKIPISSALVTVGKQPLEQGAGYAFNPTDVFITKDMMDPTYEKPGVIAMRLMVPFGDRVSVDIIGAPSTTFENWTAGGRLSARFGPLSLSAASYVTRVRQTDIEGSMDAVEAAALAGSNVEDAIMVADARRIMAGGDAILDVGGVRLWAEGAYNFIEEIDGAPNDWWELTSGLEYFFPFETHVMVEYYHYGLGPVQQNGTYDYNSWMGLLASDLKMLGRDFLFESLDHPIADFWTVGLSSFQSLSDFSATVMADLRWEFVTNAELWLLLAGNIGDNEDFLSSSKAQAWLRLKVYF